MELNEAERNVLLGCLMLPEVFSCQDYDHIREQFSRMTSDGLVLLFHKEAVAYADVAKRTIRITEAGRKVIEEMSC